MARDWLSHWLTAGAHAAEGTLLLADDQCNFFVLRQDPAAQGDDKRRLQWIAQVHLGAFVNRIEPGRLVTTTHDGDSGPVGAQYIWASADGSLGVVAALRSQEEFARLMQVTAAVVDVIPNTGDFPHAQWREFSSTRGSGLPDTATRGFVDGDALEMFLDLRPDQQEQVVQKLRAAGVNTTVELLLEEVEAFARLH